MTYRPNIERGKRVLCFYEKPEVAYRAAADSTALMPDVLRRAGTKPAALRAVAYFAFTAAAYSADAALLRYVAINAAALQTLQRRNRRLQWLLIGASMCRLIAVTLNATN